MEGFTEPTHGFHGWVFLEKWSGRHLVRSFSKRVYVALWLKEGLVDRVSSSLAPGVVAGSAEDFCCSFSLGMSYRTSDCSLTS